jgi:hypothetical protein
MKYQTPLSEDEAHALASMPRTADGFVISLFFVPREQRDALEAEWREWAKAKPKHLWPVWFDEWAEFRRSGVAPHYAQSCRP